MTTPTIEYRTIDKSAWGDGPWQSEPDKRQWQDLETGLPCLIVRGPSGALCGYVGVSPDHPAHGKGYDSDPVIDIEVHGGLTFAKGCGHGDDPAKGICHIPGDGDADHVWWFGFDCAHGWDISPAYDSYGGWKQEGAQYRGQAYVEAQVRLLAGQLADLEGAPQ